MKYIVMMILTVILSACNTYKKDSFDARVNEIIKLIENNDTKKLYENYIYLEEKLVKKDIDSSRRIPEKKRTQALARLRRVQQSEPYYESSDLKVFYLGKTNGRKRYMNFIREANNWYIGNYNEDLSKKIKKD